MRITLFTKKIKKNQTSSSKETNKNIRKKYTLFHNNPRNMLNKNEKIENTKSNIVYLFYFLFVVLVAVFFASVWKVFVIYHQNSFNSKSFSILVKTDLDKYVTVYNKNDNTVAMVLINESRGGKIKNSFYYQLPIDAEIITDNKLSYKNLFSIKAIFLYLLGLENIKLSNMTIFDYIKFIAGISNVKASEIKKISIDMKDNVISSNQQEIFDIFKDSEIINESLDIEIINATNFAGLAGRVANILKPLGVNIVSLRSQDSVGISHIKSNLKSKTMYRISEILDIPFEVGSSGRISDITIILGADFLEKLK